MMKEISRNNRPEEGEFQSKKSWSRWYSRNRFLSLFRGYFESENRNVSEDLKFLICFSSSEAKETDMVTTLELVRCTGVIAETTIQRLSASPLATSPKVPSTTPNTGTHHHLKPPSFGIGVGTSKQQCETAIATDSPTPKSRKMSKLAREMFYSDRWKLLKIIEKQRKTIARLKRRARRPRARTELPMPTFATAARQASTSDYHECELSVRDLESLAGCNLVTDNVVDLAARFSQSSRIVPLPTLAWQRLRGGFATEDTVMACGRILASNQLVGIPICLNDHWLLAVVDKTKIRIVDSLRDFSVPNYRYQLVRSIINMALTDVKRPLSVMPTRQQHWGGNNCAMYVAYRLIFWDLIQDSRISEQQIGAYVETSGRRDMRDIVQNVLTTRPLALPQIRIDGPEESLPVETHLPAATSSAGSEDRRSEEPGQKEATWPTISQGKEFNVPAAERDASGHKYTCATCRRRNKAKTFTRRAAYVRHWLDVHEQYKPFECEACGFRTARRCYLKSHTRKHQ